MTDQIFGPAPIGHGSVVLNCAAGPIQDFGIVAEAFHAMARAAVSALRADPDFGPRGGLDDYRAYPILFMYRHAVELSLKQVIIAGEFVLDYTKRAKLGDRVLKEHGLRPLVAELDELVAIHKWGDAWCCPPFSESKEFRAVLDALSAVDEKSFAFRYPVNTSGAPAWPDPLLFVLFKACEHLDRLLEALHNAAAAAAGERDAWMEAAADAAALEREAWGGE